MLLEVGQSFSLVGRKPDTPCMMSAGDRAPYGLGVREVKPNKSSVLAYRLMGLDCNGVWIGLIVGVRIVPEASVRYDIPSCVILKIHSLYSLS